MQIYAPCPLWRHLYSKNILQLLLPEGCITKGKQPIEPVSAEPATLTFTIEEPPVAPDRSSHRGIGPYDGALSPKAPGRKKDLRKLGEWIEAKSKADAIRQEQPVPPHIGRTSTKKS
jgi:hypothetical protein